MATDQLDDITGPATRVNLLSTGPVVLLSASHSVSSFSKKMPSAVAVDVSPVRLSEFV